MIDLFQKWKYYIFPLIILIIVGVFFLFQDQILKLFEASPKEEPEIALPPLGGASSTPPTASSSQTQTPAPPSIPPYTGRNPAEIRPGQKEIASFSQSDLDKIYSEIGVQAKAVTSVPDFLFGWIQLGLLKKSIGDYAGARDAWEYASLIRPLNSVSFANLGQLYWHYLPDFEKSEKNFRTSIQNDPKDITNFMALSDLYSYSYSEKQHLTDDILLEGLQKNPNNSDLMKWLGALYEREKKYSLALEWWEKALALDLGNKAVLQKVEELRAK